MTQLYFLNFAVRCVALGLPLTLDRDLDQLSAWTGANIHAAGGDKLGLVARVAAEDPEDRGHVCVVHELLVASEETRDVAAGQSGFTYDVRLPDIVPFGDPIQGRAEVAHNFFAGRVPFYGNSDLMQRPIELVN